MSKVHGRKPLLTNIQNGSSEEMKKDYSLHYFDYGSKMIHEEKELFDGLSLVSDEEGNKKIMCLKNNCPSRYWKGSEYHQPTTWSKDGKKFMAVEENIMEIPENDIDNYTKYIKNKSSNDVVKLDYSKKDKSIEAELLDFKKGMSKKISVSAPYKINFGSYPITGKKGSRYLLVAKYTEKDNKTLDGGNYYVLNIDTGKIIEDFPILKERLNSYKIETEGKLCLLDTCYEIEDDKVKKEKKEKDKEKKSSLLKYGIFDGQRMKYRYTIEKNSTQCLNNDSVDKKAEIDCYTFLNSKKNFSPIDKETQPIFLQLLCLQDFNQLSWDFLTADIADEDSSTESMKKSLLLFSKPEGFKSDKHLSRIISLIKMKSYEKLPNEFNDAMKGVLTSSNMLYEDLMEKYPEIEMPKGFKPKTTCRTPAEEKKVKKAVADFLGLKINIAFERSGATDVMDFIKKNRDLITQLDPTELDHFLEHLTSTYLLYNHSRQLRDISPIKLYKFIYRSLQKNLGLPYKDLTDITYVQDQDSINLMQLSLNPIPGAEKSNIGGFYLKNLSVIKKSSIPKDGQVIPFDWRYRNKKIQAEAGLNQLKVDDLVKFNKSPNYENMLKDKNLHGVVLFSSNLSQKEVDDTTAEYTRYFTQQGFKFGKGVKVESTESFIDKGISGKSDSFDYVIKEAHSQGSENFLLKMASQSKVLRGIKELPDGSKETIDIMVPNSSDSISIVSSNIGEKLKERSPNSELLFINASCFSGSSLVMDSSHIQNPNFLNIPLQKNSVVGTFVNHEKNSLKNIIDGIRNKDDYEKIRERLQNSPGYMNKRSELFIFPDEENYQREFSSVGMPIKVEVQMRQELPNGTKSAYPPPGDER